MSKGAANQGAANQGPAWKRWFGIAKKTSRLVSSAGILKDPTVVEATVNVLAKIMQQINTEGGDGAKLRKLTNDLIRDMMEVAARCEREPRQFRQWNWWMRHAPEPLELTVYWHQLAQISAFVAGRYLRYAKDLQSTDPSLTIVSNSAESVDPGDSGVYSGYGHPAVGTVTSLPPELAQRLYHDLRAIFQRVASVARISARQLPQRPDESVTAFQVSSAIADLYAMSFWLTEQEARIKATYHIGGPQRARATTPLGGSSTTQGGNGRAQ